MKFLGLCIGLVLGFLLARLMERGKISIRLKGKLNQRFYDYRAVFPFLNVLKQHRAQIRAEVEAVAQLKWKMWPEKHLYNNNGGENQEWSVFPFFGFGVWVKDNCKRCPVIHNILKRIPALKTATLSRLAPGTVLAPHYGWKELSNYVLRCHYGVVVNESCRIVVEGQSKKIRENEIVVFDDSKQHYAENKGTTDRIVLLLDIERPDYVEVGQSKYDDTSQLMKFIEQVNV